MDQLYPLVIAVPLLTAAAMLAARPLLEKQRQVRDLVAVAASLAVVVMLALLTYRTVGGDTVYWFGGFRPVGNVVIGWKYFTQIGTYSHVLLLTFLAGVR